jgi:hypothetical protein
MINIKTVIRFLLYGFSARLRPYEKACLEAWEQHLSPEAAELFKKQLKLYDFIQRLSKGKLVLFGCLKGRYYYRNWPKDIFFSMQREDVNVAQIFLIVSEKEKSTELRADITIHRGRFFSIEFNRPPMFAKTATVSVVRVWILVDPMSSESEKTDLPKNEPEIHGWLQEWKVSRHITNFRFPLSSSEREKAIAKTHSRLPQDYLELVSQTEGCRIDNCLVEGLSGIRKIVRPDANFYILAEIENHGSIAVMEGQIESELYYLDSENEVPQLLGQLFRKAIESILTKLPSA